MRTKHMLANALIAACALIPAASAIDVKVNGDYYVRTESGGRMNRLGIIRKDSVVSIPDQFAVTVNGKIDPKLSLNKWRAAAVAGSVEAPKQVRFEHGRTRFYPVKIVKLAPGSSTVGLSVGKAVFVAYEHMVRSGNAMVLTKDKEVYGPPAPPVAAADTPNERQAASPARSQQRPAPTYDLDSRGSAPAAIPAAPHAPNVPATPAKKADATEPAMAQVQKAEVRNAKLEGEHCLTCNAAPAAAAPQQLSGDPERLKTALEASAGAKCKQKAGGYECKLIVLDDAHHNIRLYIPPQFKTDKFSMALHLHGYTDPRHPEWNPFESSGTDYGKFLADSRKSALLIIPERPGENPKLTDFNSAQKVEKFFNDIDRLLQGAGLQNAGLKTKWAVSGHSGADSDLARFGEYATNGSSPHLANVVAVGMLYSGYRSNSIPGLSAWGQRLAATPGGSFYISRNPTDNTGGMVGNVDKIRNNIAQAQNGPSIITLNEERSTQGLSNDVFEMSFLKKLTPFLSALP